MQAHETIILPVRIINFTSAYNVPEKKKKNDYS